MEVYQNELNELKNKGNNIKNAEDINYIYDQYYYTGTLYKVNSIQNCTKSSQSLPVFQAVYQMLSFQRREPLYGDVCYISERYLYD